MVENMRITDTKGVIVNDLWRKKTDSGRLKERLKWYPI